MTITKEIISAAEFVKRYCESAGWTEREFYETQVPMPDCTSPSGWAAVSNNPLAIKAHVDLHMRDAAQPALTVWYGSMPESNGKTNWTAVLHRKGGCMSNGITIDRSEYPERVRYEADRMRYLIGELADEPDILAYDENAHSGYVWPRTKESAAVETLESKGYTWNGGQLWKPPIGNAPAYIAGDKPKSELLQRAEKLAEDTAALALRVQDDDLRAKVRADHAEWATATFGNTGPVGPLKHLSQEALETAEAPDDLHEWADMQFLFWDAQRKAGVTDEQITAAMVEKLEINKARQWPEPKEGEPRLHIK